MARLRGETGREIVLRAVQPNAGLRAGFRRRLLALVDEMTASYDRWIRAQYRAKPPAMAEDASPAKELERELKRLAKRWDARFDEAAEAMAKYFAKSASARSDAAMRSILKRGGWSVKFKVTRPMQDVMNATIAEQVGLIRSIPQEFHNQIQGLVMRSATVGRDLSTLSTELKQRYAITRRRAELIARDQNNKMTASFTRVRQVELGITQAIWLHSGGGKKPRPTHVRNSGKRYDVQKGWWDPAIKRYIWPGTEINCRCVSKPVVRGFS
jgi:uncharacterized protein with gpF-like domain